VATVIAVSSWVARGTVGLRALGPALERLGHEVIGLPTVMLSNHLGYPHVGGGAVAAETLEAMLGALEANRWLGAPAALITGYLPTPEHVDVTARLIARVRAHRPDVVVVCDPIIGDVHTGMYVPEAVAVAVREELLPLATHLKPNVFELAWLSGRSVADPVEAIAAARTLGVPVVLASSVPASEKMLANVLVTAGQAAVCTVPRENPVPQGTGDLLVALFTGALLNGKAPEEAVAAAAAGVAGALVESRGSDELNLTGAAPWVGAEPLPVSRIA